MNLTLNTIIIKNLRDKEQLKDALISLAGIDCDFNGENGIDYLRREAKDAGYESNADFFANKFVSELPTDYVCDAARGVIELYLNAWMGHDTYYDGYEYNLECVDEKKNTFALSLATAGEC